MRAEVDSESGGRPRPVSRSDTQRVAYASGHSESPPVADDDQAEWAKQEQQVCR